MRDADATRKRKTKELLVTVPGQLAHARPHLVMTSTITEPAPAVQQPSMVGSTTLQACSFGIRS